MDTLNSITKSNPLMLVVAIVQRGFGERLSDQLAAKGVTFSILALGRGTATSEMLDYLGLGETERELLFSTMTLTNSVELLKELHENALKIPGKGIAFSIPITCISSARAMQCLQGAFEMEGEEKIMDRANHYDLVVAVTNRGFTDTVMEAAKSAKATGGTVFHARRVGLNEAEKFFGVTLQPEKEIVLILTTGENRADIINAIAMKSGLQTDAKTIAFSLPVHGVAGLAMEPPAE